MKGRLIAASHDQQPVINQRTANSLQSCTSWHTSSVGTTDSRLQSELYHTVAEDATELKSSTV